MKFTEKKLKNGVTLITVPMRGNPTVTVMVGTSVGSRNETKRINGISHFLEHMCFKGTPKRPSSKEIMTELDEVGAENNAFTNYEYTAYYSKGGKKHFERLLDVVSDIYLNPLIPKEELEKERGVILQEYMMYQDNLRVRAENNFHTLLYGDQPTGWDIIGTPETIKSVTQNDFKTYHKKHYTAGNTTVVVAGNINEKEVEKKVVEKFKDITKTKKINRVKTKDSPIINKKIKKQNKPEIRIDYKDSDQTHLVLGVRSFSYFDKKNKTLRVLQAILSGAMSSRLFMKMREELGICYYVYAGQEGFDDVGYFSVHAGVDKQRLEVAIRAIIEELNKLKTELVDKEELKKTKDGLIGRMKLALESSDDLSRYFLTRSLEGRELKYPKEIEKEIRSVTAEEIQKLANELFVDENLNLALVGKHKAKSKLKKILSFK